MKICELCQGSGESNVVKGQPCVLCRGLGAEPRGPAISVTPIIEPTMAEVLAMLESEWPTVGTPAK